ncbi:MAG: hypothetical protein GXO69_07830 [Acidobacteria bacterium]|nr:hypothetical protein [Acidobacteriota bacterium]
MKKRLFSIMGGIVLSGIMVFAGGAQTICPICKSPVNKNLHVDYKGKRIYFGCGGCPEKFMKNPDKFMAEMKADGIKLAPSPTENNSAAHSGKMKHHGQQASRAELTRRIQPKCPYSGKSIDHSVYTDVSGKRVYFCGNGCKTNFLKNPKKNLIRFEKKGMKFQQTPHK